MSLLVDVSLMEFTLFSCRTGWLAGLVICMLSSLGRIVDIGDNLDCDMTYIGDVFIFWPSCLTRLGRKTDLGKEMGLIGDMFMSFLIWLLGHLHLRDILGSSWFQLFCPCHIEDNLKEKTVLSKKFKKR